MDFDDLKSAIIDGDEEKVSEVVENLLDEGKGAKEIINEGIIPAMESVGEKFDKGVFFVPDMLVSADAVEEGLKILEPMLGEEEKETEKKALFATVEGDQHDIGKNLAIMVFRGSGYKTKDLGVDVPIEEIIENVREFEPDVLGLSALLTTTMEEQEEVIESLEEEGLLEDMKVIVGGAPITQDFAEDIGADIYGKSPFYALEKLKE
ncbi:MAG: B12-binding domain-containing protein [Candidatus Aenigmatarchaeota archaeon]